MKAFEIQLYPYKEHPEIIKDFFGCHFKKSVDSLFSLFDYISAPVMEIGFWKEKFFIIQKGNLFGVIEEDGNIYIEPKYIQIIPTEDKKFLMLNTEFKWGLKCVLNKESRQSFGFSFKVPCEYDEILENTEGFCIVKQDGKYGYAPLFPDNLVIQPIYEEARPFHEGIAAVKKDGKWGFIDKTLTYITSLKYDEVGVFNGGVATVSENGNKFQIDFEGNDVSKVRSLNGYDYEYHGTCHEGLYAVTRDRMLGFTNIHGNITIPIEYDAYRLSDTIPRFSEGFACVKKGAYWGFIDKRNRVVFPFVLNSYSAIHNGVALVYNCYPSVGSTLLTVKHFYNYLNGKYIPFRTKRQPPKQSYDYHSPGWSQADLEDAYMAAMEDDISNEWNID